MKSRLSVAISVILFVLSSGPTSTIGQDGNDDEMPIGVPDLTYLLGRRWRGTQRDRPRAE